MQGRTTPFKWTHPISGQQFAMRFGADELTLMTVDPGPPGSDPFCTMQLPIIKAVLGTVVTIPISGELDPALT